MKRNSTRTRFGLLLTAAAIVSANTAVAEDGPIRWKKDLQSAAAESERDNKPMLIKFTASWCGPCQRMSKLTFRDAGVARHINGCFIPVSVDVDRNQDLVKAAGVSVYPTTVIISPKRQVLKRIAGYQTPAQMRKELGGVCRHVDHQVAAAPKKRAAPRKTVEATPVSTTARVKQSPPAMAKTVKVDEPPAFAGRCLVSMLDERKVRTGSEKFMLIFRGQTLYFHTAEFKKRFQADPEYYWPALDGTCPVTPPKNGKPLVGNPRFAVIYQKRLWLFASDEQRRRFAKNPDDFVVKTN